ncbi:MAG: sigma-70 family RNA polymerase sigma factor [Bacteroidota bacterium]
MSEQRKQKEKELMEGLLKSGTEKEQYEQMMFKEYMNIIWKGKHKYNLTEEEAKDAYTDAMLASMKAIRKGSFRGESSLFSYIQSIFFKKCIDQFNRRKTSFDEYEETSMQIPDSSQDVLAKLEVRDKFIQLKLHLNQLGERCKELLLYFAEGYSMEEITSIMGFANARTAASQKYNCKKQLLKLMENSSAK